MPLVSSIFLFLIIANLSFPGTWNFIGELYSCIALAFIDICNLGIFLFNTILTTCYSFFNMSIILLSLSVSHKDTNRIEFSLFSSQFSILKRGYV
jgi:NADH:ubiquinone oxidoreductase subunit 4 (subunit M)